MRKEDKNKDDLISIITIVFNETETLEETIQSVINQTYPNIEYIIIDGGSREETTSIIKKYKTHLTYWISEPDNGVFDAMNKGILASKGTWLNFMNAGDTFYKKTTLSDLKLGNYSDAALTYGNTLYEGEVIRKPFQIESLSFGLIMACHQSMFFNKTILKKELYYSEKFKLVCEYDLVCRIVKKYKKQYIDSTVASYLGGGISSQISNEARKARYYFVYQHFGIVGILKTILERLNILSLPKRNT